jgi:hypothetical protein
MEQILEVSVAARKFQALAVAFAVAAMGLGCSVIVSRMTASQLYGVAPSGDLVGFRRGGLRGSMR